MAILSVSANLTAIPLLVEQLKRCSAAVVRLVDRSGRGFCSGWFLTPTLVIAPGYALAMDGAAPMVAADIRIESFPEDERPWDASVRTIELLGRGAVRRWPDYWSVALLTLEHEWRGSPLEFSLDAAGAGDTVSLIQFAEGRPPPVVSFGRIRSLSAKEIEYDASSTAGSGGCPILDRAWRIAGIHLGGEINEQVNFGLSRALLLTVLQESEAWMEIARVHRIADSAKALQQLRVPRTKDTSASAAAAAAVPVSASTSTQVELTWAALTPWVSPKMLEDEEREALKALVRDPNSPRWVLRPEEREALLKSAGSLARLRKHLRAGDEQDTAHRVVRAVLKGPPYNVGKATEAELAWWVQISRWFEGIAPGLPTPAELGRTLARRAVRASLERSMGSDFRGRTAELRSLSNWFKERKGPLLLTGVGGIGKSALLARFALDRPPRTLILWLDFDRADLAPDDPVSVMAAIAELAQAQLKLSEMPAFTAEGWPKQAAALGRRIASALSRHPALLVLDSFEAAQYALKYQEIWKVLEAVAKPIRSLRLAVSGRAAVPGLTFRGKNAIQIDLAGLSATDATSMLESHGVTGQKAIKQIVALSRGVPLILQLAIRYVKSEESVANIPKALPQEIVAGYLYDRILSRVKRPEICDLVRGALVLRRVTAEMLKPVLEGLVTLPPGEPEDWFRDLASEMSLVEGAHVLTLRPEVRASTLRLLEGEKPQQVRAIDERAAQWYAAQDTGDPAQIAELVYHRLRLGDVPGAERAWRQECELFLLDAPEEIRDGAARAWLKARIDTVARQGPPLALWEQQAYSRILNARARGMDRNVSAILKERSERSAASPLLFQDAFELRKRGKREQAIELLEGAVTVTESMVTGPIERDRLALRALLAFDETDLPAADAFLKRIDDSALWRDRRHGTLDALCVQAARLWARTDRDAECQLIKQLERRRDGHPATVLAPLDVTLPRLRHLLSSPAASLERSLTEFDVAQTRECTLAEVVDHQRVAALREEPAEARRRRLASYSRSERELPLALAPPQALGLHGKRDQTLARLTQLGWSRWLYAGATGFIHKAAALTNTIESQAPSMEIAILGTLALFSIPAGELRIVSEGRAVGDSILSSYVLNLPWKAYARDWKRIREFLEVGVDPDFDWDVYVRRSAGGRLVLWPKRLIAHRPARSAVQERTTGLGPLLLSLVARDPLTQLVSELAGEGSDER